MLVQRNRKTASRSERASDLRSAIAAVALLVGAGCVFADGRDEATLLRSTQQQFQRIAERLRPSLVRIDTVGGAQPTDNPQAPTPNLDDDDQGEDQGGPARPRQRSQLPFRDTAGSEFVVAEGPTTGLVFRPDGYILASSFNFVREPALITVTLADGRRLAADLVARDKVRKLALLKIDAGGLTPPEWVPRDQIEVGQWAVALGLGFGGDSPAVTVGIVSALNRMHGNAIQTDAKLSPANYGGPLCDLQGRVLGICVPMAQRPGELAGVEFYDAGIGFALPKERVESIAAELLKGRSFYRGWLGIVVDPRSPKAVVIQNIADPSPLLEVGVIPGDRILRANGEDIRHFGSLVQALYMIPAGELVRLDVERDDAAFSVEVRLARNVDLGPLPDLTEPFDPAEPLPDTPGSDGE